MSSRVPSVAALLVLAWSAGSPAADAPPNAVLELQKQALGDRRAYATLADLTGTVGHRFAGSEGDARAVAWALATLRAQGFQNVRAEPVTVPRWVRGTASVQVVGERPLDLTALEIGGSVGTAGRPVEGEIVAATTLDELKNLSRSDVAGRIVFLYDRMIATRDGMDYGPTVANRVQGAVEAAKKGAVAVVIRAVGSEDEDRPHTGSLRYANGVPRIPAFAIGNRSADRLLARLAEGPVRVRVASTAGCQGTAESANVIGEIPGRDPQAGFVLLGAHLDSWDVGTGAQDDGAGVATVIEAARRVGELAERPRRSLRVVLYANEEFGLSGGKRYALDHEDELPRHLAALEADLGSGRVFRYESRVGLQDLSTAIRLASWLAPLGIPFASNDTGGGADISPLRERGVPVFDLQHDAGQYFEIHHTDADRLDRVDPKDLAFNVAAYATLAYGLADLPGELARGDREWPAPSAGVHACEWQP